MVDARPSRRSSIDGSSRGELLERAVHDLKNPLAVVRSALEWLEDELAGREDALDAVRDASTATARVLAIVDDLDALARLDRGEFARTAALDLATTIRVATAAASTRLAPRGLTVTSVVPPELRCAGDSSLLLRTLGILLDACARGATPGTCIELAARVTGEEGAGNATGSGIEIEIGQQGAVRAGPETDVLDAIGAGGLGVSLAQKVAQVHDGSLVVMPTATMPRAALRLPR